MIYDRDSNALICNRCGCTQPLTQGDFSNPETYMILSEDFDRAHQNCKIPEHEGAVRLQLVEKIRVWRPNGLVERVRYISGGAA